MKLINARASENRSILFSRLVSLKLQQTDSKQCQGQSSSLPNYWAGSSTSPQWTESWKNRILSDFGSFLTICLKKNDQNPNFYFFPNSKLNSKYVKDWWVIIPQLALLSFTWRVKCSYLYVVFSLLMSCYISLSAEAQTLRFLAWSQGNIGAIGMLNEREMKGQLLWFRCHFSKLGLVWSFILSDGCGLWFDSEISF